MVRGLVEKVGKIDKTKGKLNCTKKVEFVCAHGPPCERLGEYLVGTQVSLYLSMWLALVAKLNMLKPQGYRLEPLSYLGRYLGT